MNDWKSIKNKTGNLYQVAGTRHYMLTDGSQLGTRAIDVKTGSGFEYTVLPDRGLDISLASYKGTNLVYLGTQGEVAPQFYNCAGTEWLRMFYAGLLTTCGPNYIGPPCVDAGETLGLHGRFNNTPARRVCDLTDIEKDDGVLEITGQIDCSVMFGARTRTKRRIMSYAGESRVFIEDTLVNDSGVANPLALLYHINMGYPLLDDCVQIRVNSSEVEPCSEYSARYIDSITSFLPPDGKNMEKNYLHKFSPDIKRARAEIFNPKLQLGMYIEFETAELGYLNQWKLENVRDYVLGLEPCVVPCESRNILREKGLLPFLAPGERRTQRVEIGVIDNISI